MSYEGVWFCSVIQKTNSVRIFVEKKSWKFFPVVFLQVCYFSGEHFNGCKICHGKLKTYDIFSCVNFTCEKSNSRVFLKFASVYKGPIEDLPLK